MFTPGVLAVPIFNGLGGGVVLYPSIEALAVGLMVALVGCTIALLCEGFGELRGILGGRL